MRLSGEFAFGIIESMGKDVLHGIEIIPTPYKDNESF